MKLIYSLGFVRVVKLPQGNRMTWQTSLVHVHFKIIYVVVLIFADVMRVPIELARRVIHKPDTLTVVMHAKLTSLVADVIGRRRANVITVILQSVVVEGASI